MDTPDATGLVRATGQVRGGHEYCLVGCDVASKTIRAANSWGSGWGASGYFSISWEDFASLLSRQGDATVPAA